MTNLLDQTKTINKHNNQIVISLVNHNFGIDVRATLYIGGIDNAKLVNIVNIAYKIYTNKQADAARNHFNQLVAVMGDA